MIIATALVGILFVGSLLLVLKRAPEKSAPLLGIGIALTFVTGLLFTMLVPSFNENWSSNTAVDPTHFHAVYAPDEIKKAEAEGRTPRPLSSIEGVSRVGLVGYTPLQQHGRRVYQREGCLYCHSQQIRPLDNEMRRYSIGSSLAVPANEQEYIWDQPHFLGTRRIGPDLSREGGKYSDDWHYSHFYYPRQMVAGSIMPAFTWLFTKDADGNPTPNADLHALVAYVQTLGYGRQVFDPTLNGGKGAWRSWLKPQDQVITQNLGENAVVRASEPVRGGDRQSPTNRVTPQTTVSPERLAPNQAPPPPRP